MATAVQTGMNMLQVGALRMPFMFAQMNAALLVGEAAYRATTGTLGYLGFTGESEFMKKLSSYAPTDTVKILRPYKDLTVKQLTVSALACAIIGNLGAAAVSAVFGNPPAIYNRALSLLGNFRVTDELHPVLDFAGASFSRRSV